MAELAADDVGAEAAFPADVEAEAPAFPADDAEVEAPAFMVDDAAADAADAFTTLVAVVEEAPAAAVELEAPAVVVVLAASSATVNYC